MSDLIWTNTRVRLGDLQPWERNPKTISKRNAARLLASWDEMGQFQTVAVGPGGEVYDGHQRLSVLLAARGPEYMIDARQSNRPLTEDERAKLVLTAHVGTTGSWNWDALSGWDESLLQGCGFDAALLKELNDDAANLNEMLRSMAGGEPAEAPEAQIDRAAELQEKWGTCRGQLWEIPSQSVPGRCHRVLCGDSTDAGDVAQLMGSERAEMVWLDPPYGVAVGDKNKMLNAIAPSNRVEENLTNDTLDEPELVAMLERSFDCAIQHCTAGGAWYVAAPAVPLHVLFGGVLKARGIWRQTIQWVKNNATFAPLGVDYHWRAEPIFYGWLPNAGHRYYGGRQQDTVWNIDRPVASPEHPTMKPPELVARAINNSSQAGEVVMDLFLGSGTTLVACEQTGRIGYGCEIEPKYVAVTLERLADMGLAPRLAEPVAVAAE